MGMTTHIVGFRPPDAEWKKMKEVWDTCEAAGVEVPSKVHEFFGYDTPDEAGVTVKIEESDAVTEYSTEGEKGYDVDVTKLPEGLRIIRFFNNW